MAAIGRLLHVVKCSNRPTASTKRGAIQLSTRISAFGANEIDAQRYFLKLPAEILTAIPNVAAIGKRIRSGLMLMGSAG